MNPRFYMEFIIQFSHMIQRGYRYLNTSYSGNFSHNFREERIFFFAGGGGCIWFGTIGFCKGVQNDKLINQQDRSSAIQLKLECN